MRTSFSIKRLLLFLWGIAVAISVAIILYQTFLEMREHNNMGFLVALRGTLQFYIFSLQAYLKKYQVIAPLILLVVYILRPFLFLPASILTILSGAVFGPFYGILITLVGENLAANTSFFVARYFAGNKNVLSKLPFLKKLSVNLHSKPFLHVFIARLIWIPFDLVSYGFGFSGMRWRSYFWGTFWGTLPGMVTVVLLGSSVILGKQVFVIGAGLFAVTILVSYVCKKCLV